MYRSRLLDYESSDYRVDSTEKNRPDKKMPKRSNIEKDLSKDNRSRVIFIVGYDSTSYHFKFDYDKGTHEFHLLCSSKKNILNNSKLLNYEERSIARVCDKSKERTCNGVDINNSSGEY